MKKTEVVLREFSPKKIVTSDELKKLCSVYGLNFGNTKKLLLNRDFLITIFRGIYYLKDYNERRTGTMKYSPNELLSIGLALKGITNWYFGLDTALKMLNLTHEVFAVNYVVNDRFNRVKPMRIADTDFRFIRLKPSLFFGIKKTKTKNGIVLNYSDLEKTLLDRTYLLRRAGKTDIVIKSAIAEYIDRVTRKRIIEYSEHYPTTVRKIIAEATE